MALQGIFSSSSQRYKNFSKLKQPNIHIIWSSQNMLFGFEASIYNEENYRAKSASLESFFIVRTEKMARAIHPTQGSNLVKHMNLKNTVFMSRVQNDAIDVDNTNEVGYDRPIYGDYWFHHYMYIKAKEKHSSSFPPQLDSDSSQKESSYSEEISSVKHVAMILTRDHVSMLLEFKHRGDRG